MNWFDHLFYIHSAVQTVIVLALIIAIGLGLGKMHIRGISLGVAFVFFVGIVAGHLNLTADEQMLDFAETFGLSLFIYTLGLYVGPNFFGLMRDEGIKLNLWSFAVIALGTIMAVGLSPIFGISMPNMVGILCGATTNARPGCRTTGAARGWIVGQRCRPGLCRNLSAGCGGRHHWHDADTPLLRASL